jgi:hypothetical protein
MPWELDGNSNINGNNNFLGTRNDAPVVIRTNTNGAPPNLEEVMRVTPSSQTARGRVGIATSNPLQQLTLGSGNVQLPAAQDGTNGNLYLGGRTDAGEIGLRLFGGLVNGSIPGGFIDVRTTSAQEGLRIRVDTANGGTERVRVTANGDVGIGTDTPSQRLTLGSGNVRLPAAQAGTNGNLYLGGRTDAGETGLRLFGGLVNGNIPGGFIDVRTTSAQEGLRIRVDTANGGTERMRVTSTEVRSTVPFVGPGSPSDVRAKVNVRPLSGMLDRLENIRSVAFDWVDSPEVSGSMSGKPGIGVIAQEVEAAFPELVREYGELQHKAVDYNGLIAALLGAAKELRNEVEGLRSRIKVLEHDASAG